MSYLYVHTALVLHVCYEPAVYGTSIPVPNSIFVRSILNTVVFANNFPGILYCSLFLAGEANRGSLFGAANSKKSTKIVVRGSVLGSAN